MCKMLFKKIKCQLNIFLQKIIWYENIKNSNISPIPEHYKMKQISSDSTQLMLSDYSKIITTNKLFKTIYCHKFLLKWWRLYTSSLYGCELNFMKKLYTNRHQIILNLSSMKLNMHTAHKMLYFNY